MIINDTQRKSSSYGIPIKIILLLLTCLKLLLIPFYRSTDFDVHRNWLALTRHLPLSEWYYNDLEGKTAHTLDYPPAFAFFEYFLSNNNLTEYLVKGGYVQERCFALLPDAENEVGLDCVIFQRCTVILADVVFLIGAWSLTRAMLFYNDNDNCAVDEKVVQNKRSWCFILVVTNSGVILLDHIHFQYNGMMLGILLASLACILQSIKAGIFTKTKSRRFQGGIVMLELFGSILFAVLLTFKHLYLTLAPMYFFYLLRRFCFVETGNNNGNVGESKASFSIPRIVLLGSTVLLTLFIPFSPFLLEGKAHILQMLSRLFPFQRGLCHDYWAGNVWAVYLFAEKVWNYACRIQPALENTIPLSFPEISPTKAAVCLLLGLIPAMQGAYLAAANPNLKAAARQEALLYCTVYSSLTSFMLAYHVHEKAIMTAIIPMTYLAFISKEGARLFLRTMALGHFGLMPLLWRKEELMVKVMLNLTYFVLCALILNKVHAQYDQSLDLLRKIDKIGIGVLMAVFLYKELLHEFIFGADAFEFLPLLLTSLCCALGLFFCWIRCGLLMSTMVTRGE